jgi:hypothetical protein
MQMFDLLSYALPPQPPQFRPISIEPPAARRLRSSESART